MKENAWTYTPKEDHWLFSSVQFSSVVQRLKRLPAMWETWVRSLGREDPLEKDMATHSSILGWGIPMDRGAWWATVHRVAKSWTRREIKGGA